MCVSVYSALLETRGLEEELSEGLGGLCRRRLHLVCWPLGLRVAEKLSRDLTMMLGNVVCAETTPVTETAVSRASQMLRWRLAQGDVWRRVAIEWQPAGQRQLGEELRRIRTARPYQLKEPVVACSQCAKMECERSTRGLEAVLLEGLGGQKVSLRLALLLRQAEYAQEMTRSLVLLLI